MSEEKAKPEATVATDQERQKSILVNPPEQPKAEEHDPVAEQRAVADRLGNEVGALRKENRELQEQLRQFLAQQSQPPPEEPVSFNDDPDRWLEQRLGSLLDEKLGPQLQVLNSDLQRRVSGEFEAQMYEADPEWETTAKSPEFAAWVQANPGMRYLVERAATQFDVQAGLEALKRFRQDASAEAKRREGAFGAATMSTGGSGDGAARTYNASEIQHLKQTDPEAYSRWLSAEGMSAYREGRVLRR